MSVSTLILTLNEEVNLPGCLESVAWSDDIVVFDSFSTDRTVEIAQAAGARVVQRQFDNWSAHQNWAVENIEFKYPWVYYTDADERVPLALAQEILSVTGAPDRPEAAYRLRFQNFLFGKWVKHSSLYPTWVLRLFRPKRIRWERIVNPVAVVDGPVGRLEGHFEHHSFNKGLAEWFDKHNKYSTGEAQELIRSSSERIDWGGIVCLEAARRRKAQKQLAYRLPGRPLLMFLALYVVRLGFLDGRAGLIYCTLRAIYEYMIDVKVKELRRREQRLPM
jgi:glycosyltransferase involved in cell wall biosynthesis